MNQTPHNKPQPGPLSGESFNAVKDRAQEALQNPEDAIQKAQSLAQQYKPLLITVGLMYLGYRVEKRMVTKIVRSDTLIIKEHLRQLTMAVDDLAGMAQGKRFGADTFLRGVVDSSA